MNDGFSRARAVLASDTHTIPLRGLGLALALLGVWGYWFVCAPISVLEVSDKARVEVGAAAHVIQSEVPGRIVRVDLELGRVVTRGEPLLELDSTAERLRLESVLQRHKAATAQRDGIEREMVALRQAQDDLRAADFVSVNEARQRYAASRSTAELAHEEKRRLEQLRVTGHLGEFEFLRSRSESETRTAQTSALGLGVERIQLESKMHQSEKSADSARLNRMLAEAEAEIAVTLAEKNSLEFEIARRTIRAPVSGSLGDVTILHAGSFVPQGVKLCAVVPEDGLKVVAEFPLRSVGRVHSGQPGRLRLLAFPWIEYGSVPVTVTRVGTESTEGDVRVELAIASQHGNVIPIQHGLTGSVQVEVENVSPAGFALRSAGRLLTDN